MSRFCVPLSGPIDKHPALRFEIGSLVILVHRPIDPTVLPDKKKLLAYRKVDKQTWGRRTSPKKSTVSSW